MPVQTAMTRPLTPGRRRRVGGRSARASPASPFRGHSESGRGGPRLRDAHSLSRFPRLVSKSGPGLLARLRSRGPSPAQHSSLALILDELPRTGCAGCAGAGRPTCPRPGGPRILVAGGTRGAGARRAWGRSDFSAALDAGMGRGECTAEMAMERGGGRGSPLQPETTEGRQRRQPGRRRRRRGHQHEGSQGRARRRWRGPGAGRAGPALRALQCFTAV